MKPVKFIKTGFVVSSLVAAGGLQAQEQLQTSQDTIRLTLDQAIKVAMDQNPTIVVDSMEVQRTNFAKKESLSSLYPTLDFNGSYSYTIKKQTMSMGGQSIEIGTDHNWSFGFSASLPLINVPLWKTVKLTNEQIEAKREAARETKIQMVSTITEAYYSLLNAKDSYNVLLSSFATANENLRITRERYKNGLTSEYDTIQTSVQVQSIEPNLIAAKRGIELATLQLKILMGMPDQYPVTVQGSLSDYEKNMFSEINLSDLDTTLADNPTLRQLDVNARMLEQQLKITKGQWYPTLNLTATLNWLAMSDDLKIGDYEWNPYSTVGLTLNFPIFRGMGRINKQKSAEVQYKEIAYTREDTKRQLRLGLQNDLNSLRVAIETINSTKRAVASAQKSLDISQKRYEVGAGTTLELTTAQNALTNAQLQYLQAIYDYIVAKNGVESVMGNAYGAYVQ